MATIEKKTEGHPDWLSQEAIEIMEREIGSIVYVQTYHLLVKAMVLPEITAGGLFMPDTVRSMNQRDYNVGMVIAMGPEAYQPKEKFPYGPSCKLGDWVEYSGYERDNSKPNGHECYYITDQKVRAVIPDISSHIRELRTSIAAVTPDISSHIRELRTSNGVNE